MKRLLALLLLLAPTAFPQTSANGRIMEGPLANRPAICSPGDYYVSQDQNPVVEYKCSTGNIWNAEATGGGGGGTSAGTNGTVQCGDGAGNFVSCHVNDNVTFPGFFFVNEALLVSGNATLSGEGNAGNVALKTFSSDSIRYVSSNGFDTNDGLSQGTAQYTIYAAACSLPGGNCSTQTSGSGTVFCLDICRANPTSGAGIQFMGPIDPNYSSPPAGWLKISGQQAIAVIGVVAQNGGTGPEPPKAYVIGGSGADINHPGLWISGTNVSMLFQNLVFQYPGRPIVIGEDSNHGRSGLTGGVQGVTLWNIGENPNSVAGLGPGIDIVGGSFWNTYEWISAAGLDNVNTPTANNAQAILFDGTGNDGTGENTVEHIAMTSGCIKLNPGTVSRSIESFDAFDIESENNRCPANVWATSGGFNIHLNYVRVNDPIGTSCNGSVCAVENDGLLPDSVVVEGPIVSSALPPLKGPMMVEGAVYGMVYQGAITSSFLRSGFRGIMANHLVARDDVSAFQFGPTYVLYPNTVSNPASYSAIAGSTITQNVADRSGNSTATRVSATGPGEGMYLAPVTGITVNVGDWFILAGGTHSFTNNGYAGNNPLQIGISGCTISFTNIYPPGLGGTGSIPVGGDGQWDIDIQGEQVASVSGGTCQQNILAAADATHTLDVFSPVYLHIPAASALSNNGMMDFINSLQLYSNSCTAGQLCTPQGVVGSGGGLPSGTQGEALVNSNGATAYQTTPAYLDCSVFTAADWGLIAQACLAALNTLNSTAGTADMRGVSTSTTASVNPMGGTMPASGTMLLGPGTYLTNVPFVKHSDWIVQGVSVRGVDGQVGTTIKAGASFHATYTTGTITVGTPGANEVITGSGTTWTSGMVGCEFYGANGGANSTFGIILPGITATSLTLGWGTNLGSGAAGGSSYTIACGLGADGSGGATSAGDQYGMWDTNINYDCNNVVGAIGLVDWFGNQGTGATNVGIHNCNNIGLDIENQFQNSGPWNNVTISAGSGCSASTLLLVVHGNQQAFKGINGLNLSQGACATKPNVGADIAENGTVISGGDFASVGIGALFGANTTCPVACAVPGRATSGWEVDNIYLESTATTAIESSNAFATNQGWQVRNIVNSGTNALIDLANSCTNTDTRLGVYETNTTGKIAISTSALSGCTIWNPTAIIAAAVTDTALTSGSSVCAGTGGLLATSGCPPVNLANRVVSGTTSTDTILAADCFNRVTYQTSVSVATALPTPTTLSIAGCALRLTNSTTGASSAITITPTTLTIGPNASATFQIQKGQFCTLTVDGTNWDTDCTFGSTTNCASSASPAVCGASSYGSVAIPTGVGSSTLTVNTTVVTANSVIVFYPDDTLGTKLGVTCNSTLSTLVGGSAITTRTAGTSFQITFNGTIATNPVCGNYEVIN
jgi:hypothetical protein